MEIRFLGQSGVRLETSGGTVLYVDPCLSDYVESIESEPELWKRVFPPPVAAGEIDDATAVLVTHEHGDHMDPWTLGPLLGASPDAQLVGPQAAAELTTPERFVLARKSIEIGDATVTPVPAAHGNGYAPEETESGHRWLGYVIEADGLRVYHAGDTVRHDDVVAAVGQADVALLPINGRDAYRDAKGIIGNLWPREAIELGRELGARAVIPLHHDLYAWNGISTGELFAYRDRCGYDIDVHELAAGESRELS